MTKRLLIDATHSEEIRVVIADEARIYDFDISATTKTQNKGNIYLAKVTRVEPSLQAAFVEYGGNRQGFLPFSEIHPDYYQIPVADRKKLLEEVAAAVNEANEAEETASVREPSNSQDSKEDGRGDRFRGRRRRFRGRRRSFDRREQNTDETTGETSEINAENFEEAEGEKEFTSDWETSSPAEELAEGSSLKETSEPKPYYMQELRADESERVVSDVIEIEESEALEAIAIKTERTHVYEEPILPSEHMASSEQEEIIVPATEVAFEQNTESKLASFVQEVDDNADEEKPEETGGGGSDVMDEDEFARRRKASYLRRYKIQEVIKKGQVVLVQVVKEERGNKGASLSTFISLAGRYCVLMPNSPKTGGISRKISNGEDRRRLKEISEEMRNAEGMSAIIRTAGIDRTRAEIHRDFDYLVKLWHQIRDLTLSSTAPALVYEEADIINRSLRDLYSSDIHEVIIAGEDEFRRGKEFMGMIMPSHAPRVKLHRESTPIFYAYDVEDQLINMHEPNVRLESGGSIVLNPTEALVSIDVNSGRSTSERNVEETALKTNLEAAQEIARQLRLRDLAGLIVIDFIDMFDFKNRRAVERQLKEALKNDRAKIQVGRISAFGLLEMSRQRMRPSLSETNAVSCPHCEGKGFILSPETLAIRLIRLIAKEASSGDFAILKLKVPSPVALYLLNQLRARLLEMEQIHKTQILVEFSDLASASSFVLERTNHEGQKTEINSLESSNANKQRNNNRKRKRGRDRDRFSNTEGDANLANDNMEENAHQIEEKAEEQVVSEEQTRSEPGERQDKDRDRNRRRRGNRRRDRDRNRPRDGENAGNIAGEPQEATHAEPTYEEASFTENREEVTVEAAQIINVDSSGDSEAKAEKPAARKRKAASPRKPRTAKKEAASADEPKAAEVQEKIAPSKTPRAAARAVSEAVAPSVADKPERELETVLSGGESYSAEPSSSEKKSTRKGWWRRIVE